MKVEATTGPQFDSDGSSNDLRQGRLGDLIVVEMHGKYAEDSLRGNVFAVVQDAAANVDVTGTTGPITLVNPAGSGKNLVLIAFDLAFTTINAATLHTDTYALAVNTNVVATAISAGTALTPVPTLVGSNVRPVANAYRSTTLPANPTILWPFAYKLVGGAAAAVPITGVPSIHIDFEGTVILTPGTAITPQLMGGAVADTTKPAVICGFRWSEIPV